MSIDALVALLTTVLSVLVKVVGMPDQIRSNYRRKSTDGLSGWFLFLTLISCAIWVVQGLMAHDMSLVIGQGLGVLVTAVIVWQVIIYRKKTAHAPKSPSFTVSWYMALRRMITNRVGTGSQPIDQDETPVE